MLKQTNEKRHQKYASKKLLLKLPWSQLNSPRGWGKKEKYGEEEARWRVRREATEGKSSRRSRVAWNHKVCGTNGQLWTDFLLSVYSYGKWEHFRLYQCFPKWGDHWKILSDTKRKNFKTFQSCQLAFHFSFNPSNYIRRKICLMLVSLLPL